MDTSFSAAPEEDCELEAALALAKGNSTAKLPESTYSMKPNQDWKSGSDAAKRKISFAAELTVAKFTEDGITEVESKNAFPFPVGTNPDVQTVSYGLDIKDIEDRSALQNFDVAAVLAEKVTAN